MNRNSIAKISVLTFLVGVLALTGWAVYPVLRPASALPSTKVLDRNGGLLYEVTRPEGGVRTTVTLDKMPISLKQATVAAEDARFYKHAGVDWLATGRAVWQLVTRQEVVSGASTLEQQTVKNLYFVDRSRSPLQKVREILAAQSWSLTHTKEQTLEIYLNTVPLGNNSFGVAAAAKTYFHKDVSDLTVAESAILSGMLSAPSNSDPYRHWNNAKKRQTYVLDRMLAQGFIDKNQYAEAMVQDVQTFAPRHAIKAPHFVMYVLDQLETEYPDIRNGGYTIKTTLDPDLQTATADTVARRLAKIADQKVTNGAVVAMDPQTGEILAYVGSNGYFDDAIQGQVDMVQAKRQAGSALKPFMYFDAFRQGLSPATVIADLPVRFETAEGKPYYPRNYSYKYYGPVTIRETLGSSLNIPAVKVLDKIGLSSFFATLQRFGVEFPEQPEHYGLGVVLGGGEVTLSDVTAAYAKMSLMAKSVDPIYVLEIKDADGRIVQTAKPAVHQSLFTDQGKAERAAYLVTDVLTDKAARSKSFGEANLLDVGQPVAAKTGTTRDFHDNWAFGYTPNFVLGVWVGNANGAPMQGVSGITGAVPIWHDIMRMRIENQGDIVWKQPDGLVMRRVCVTSGLLVNDTCPKTRDELFIAGNEPTKQDDWYVGFDIDANTGLVATDKCRGNVIHKTFLQPPTEYASWLTAAKHELPPTRDCEGREVAVDSRSRQLGAGEGLKIISPLDGDTFEHDYMIDPANQRVPFIAGGTPTDNGSPITNHTVPYHWTLNGQTLESSDPTYLWDPQPGSYTLKLQGSNDEIKFNVK